MPSVSKKQHNLMALVANDPKAAKRLGIKQSVGAEFMKADKGKKFKEGGSLKEVDSSENPGLSKLPTEVRNKMGYMKKGGMAKGYAKGGCATKSDAKMIAKKEVKGHESSMHGMKKGGACKGYAKGGIIEKGTSEKYSSKAAMMKHEKKESKAEEMKEHGMKKGGSCKGYKEGGVAKTVTKEMEYDYKTGKKSFAGSTAKKDAHAEKEGKMVAKHLAYDKSKKFARGGGIEVRGKTKGKLI